MSLPYFLVVYHTIMLNFIDKVFIFDMNHQVQFWLLFVTGSIICHLTK